MRWLTSLIMTRMSKPEQLEKQRAKFERQRIKAGAPRVLEYFHQVDDGYSHLAAQTLQALAARYDVKLVCHMVPGPQGGNVADAELLLKLSRYDAFHVAPAYGLTFPEHPNAPDNSLLRLAKSILAAQDGVGFMTHLVAVGQALWSGDEAALKTLAVRLGSVSEEQAEAKIAEGAAYQAALKHYSGAMFYYAGEWYWGVDRLYHLEKRLAAQSADLKPGEPMLMPRPAVEASELKDDGSLTLEIYPSLRSPYTAVVFDRAVQLAKATGIKLVTRPVLPMVMRGVPATRQKGMYIFQDAAREAREAGVSYGQFADPIGDPVRRAYSLYPWACEQSKGNELISSFLRCAFAEGINTNTEKGLRTAVEKAGLEWEQAQSVLGKPGWEDLLESNRLAMYEAGLWGVPSFRLLNARGEQVLALWGQDRLWLFAREIQRQLEMGQQARAAN